MLLVMFRAFGGPGMVTPFGGTGFIISWFALLLAVWRIPR
jgi:uncharacterized membrane protein YgdD (TMEM256/DUF423 family)